MYTQNTCRVNPSTTQSGLQENRLIPNVSIHPVEKMLAQLALYHYSFNLDIKSVRMMVVLVNNGAELYSKDITGISTFQRGLQLNSLRIAKFLGSLFHVMLDYKDQFGHYPGSKWHQRGYSSEFLGVFKGLVTHVSEMNSCDESGYTVLHHAAREYEDLAIYLIRKLKLNVNVRTKQGDTPIHIALQSRKQRLTKLLLQQQPVLDCGDKTDNRTLRLVFKHNILSILPTRAEFRSIKNYPELLQLQDIGGNTLLHFAILHRKFDMVLHMVRSNSVCIHMANYDGNTPVHMACTSNFADLNHQIPSICWISHIHKLPKRLVEAYSIQTNNTIKILNILLQYGGSVSSINNMGQTPLDICFETANYAAFNVLLAKMQARQVHPLWACGQLKHAINKRNVLGDTALLVTCRCNPFTEFARFLLSIGADKTMRDASNKKATEVAVECKNYPVLMVLLQHGEDMNESLKTGDHYIHKAVESSNMTLLRFLLSKGANVNILTKNRAASMPLNLAFYNGSLKMVQILLEAGADSNIHGFHLNTPMHEIAFCKSDAVKITSLLLQYGAKINSFNFKQERPAETFVNYFLSKIKAGYFIEEERCKSVMKVLISAGCCFIRMEKLTNVTQSRMSSLCIKKDRSLCKIMRLVLPVSVILKYISPDVLAEHATETSVTSLQKLCGRTIRMSLYPNAWVAVSKLPVPKLIQDFIICRYLTEDEELY